MIALAFYLGLGCIFTCMALWQVNEMAWRASPLVDKCLTIGLCFLAWPVVLVGILLERFVP